MKADLRAILAEFRMPGALSGVVPCGRGLINDTYRADFVAPGRRTRYILQRINHHVFKDPAAVMDNIRRVTAHLAEKSAAGPGSERRILTLVPANDGRVFHCDAAGNYWRAWHYVENAQTFDSVQTPRQAFESAKAFGRFQQLLSDLPAPRLHDTIPGFHNTPARFAAFEKALAADAANRAALAKTEIAFALQRRDLTGVVLAANLPERVIHNDTKLNNVMLDDATGEAVCVVDLDTVMPGLAVYDFGDMVRTTTSSAPEDERNLARVTMQFPMFEALARGYLSSAADFLTPAEKQLLAFSGKLITFENGLRFLSDFLAGDTYYKVQRPDHNLDRCRTQFKLVESIERQESQMTKLVASL